MGHFLLSGLFPVNFKEDKPVVKCPEMATKKDK